MFLNVYLSEFFWHTLIKHSCCCCLEELEVWVHMKIQFFVSDSLQKMEKPQTTNLENL